MVDNPHKVKLSKDNILLEIQAEYEQIKQQPSIFRPTLVEIRTDEVALDLWTFERDTKTNTWHLASLYRTGLLCHLETQQFAKRYRSDGVTSFLIRGESVIEPVSVTKARDCLKVYIESNKESMGNDSVEATFEGRLEIFNRQQHLTVNATGLESLKTHERPLLHDNPLTCFIPYQNGIVEVTRAGATLLPYEMLNDRCVWKSQVLNRDYNPNATGEQSHFAQFLRNVANNETDRFRAFRSAIGYLLHHYGNPAEGQCVVCYDQEITDAQKPEGGTGKGVFANAIRQIRPVAVLDGKKFDQNDRFCFQSVEEDTAVVWIDDPTVNHPKAERRFTVERFFSTLTEGWSVEKKNQQSFRILAKEGPKLLISSNVVMPNDGSSNIRRQFVIEFSDHYSKQILIGNERPIQSEHGCIFFSEDWDNDEWARFDQFMISCVSEYLRDGLQAYQLRSANKNRLRQTAGDDFYEWITTYEGTGLVPNKEYSRDELWTDYKAYAGLLDNMQATRLFTNNISQFAKGNGWKYERGKNQRGISFTLKLSDNCI